MIDWLPTVRARIAEAIGGRSGALAFEKASNGRFRRTTIQRWIDGGTWPDIAELTEFAEATGRPLEWFFGLEKPEPVYLAPPGTVIVPILNVEASAGHGHVAEVVQAEASFAFPHYFLLKLIGERAFAAKLESLRSKGHSMAPTIIDGALLIVDRAQRTLPGPQTRGKAPRRRKEEPDIFVFYQGEDLRLKRLERIDRDYVAVISDNHAEFPVEICKLGDDGAFNIIGKVIWWDNRL